MGLQESQFVNVSGRLTVCLSPTSYLEYNAPIVQCIHLLETGSNGLHENVADGINCQ